MRKHNKGITLIALVITIIVMLILVAVTVNVAMNGGLFNTAQKAKAETDKEKEKEQLMVAVMGALDNTGMYNKEKLTTLPQGMKWLNNETKEAVETSTGNVFYIDSNGNIVATKYTDKNGKSAPIPTGFTVSQVNTENTIDNGLVIYEGTQTVTNDNVEQSKTTINQYVWIPIDNPSNMYGIDSNGNKLGKAYAFDGNGNASAYYWTEENGVIEHDVNREYTKEPAIVDVRISNISNVIDADQGITLTKLQEEFNNMIESIEKYKGFYVGRYEIGGLNTNKAVVRAGEQGNEAPYSINRRSWYEIYWKAKTLSNSFAQTNMIWGCQWDQIMIFTGCANKGISSSNIIETGKIAEDCNKNIYDLCGNLSEFTMETTYDDISTTFLFRVTRGGNFHYNETHQPWLRHSYLPSAINSNFIGSRAILYINN